MGEEDAFDNAQTEAGPGHFPFMCFFTSVISVPDFFGFIFGDACTVIVNVHSYAVSFYTVKAQLYVFVVAGIIYGVADEVGEHLKDFFFVGDHDYIGFYVFADVVIFEHFEIFESVFGCFAEVELREYHFLFLRLKFAQFNKVVDKSCKAGGFGDNNFEMFVAFFFVVSAEVTDHFRIAFYEGKRRFEVV